MSSLPSETLSRRADRAQFFSGVSVTVPGKRHSETRSAFDGHDSFKRKA